MNYMALKQYTKIMDIGFKSLDAVLDFYITLLLFVKLIFRANLLCVFRVNNHRLYIKNTL